MEREGEKMKRGERRERDMEGGAGKTEGGAG